MASAKFIVTPTVERLEEEHASSLPDLLSAAIDDSAAIRAKLSKDVLGGSRVAIDPVHIRDGILLEQQFDEFIWGLEFSRDWQESPNGEKTCLVLKYRSEKSVGETLVVGPIVSIGMLRKGAVMVTVENVVCQAWVKLELPSKNFSSVFNCEWLSSGELSVISLGFFPKTMGVERLTAGVHGMMVADIMFGYLYVKYNMMKDKSCFEIPATWIMSNMLETAGLITELEYNAYIDRDIAFDDFFSFEMSRKWVDKLKLIQTVRSARQPVAAVIERDRSEDVSKKPEKRKAAISMDTSTQSPKKLTKRKNPEDESLASSKKPSKGKDVVLEKALSSEKLSKPKAQRSKEKNADRTLVVAPSAQKMPKRKEHVSQQDPVTSVPLKKKRKKIPTEEPQDNVEPQSVPAMQAELTLHLDDDLELDAPAIKKVLEGSEILKMMEQYYTFGINEIFLIPVESIIPAPARLCYRMLNSEHVQDIANSMVAQPGLEPQVADLIPYSSVHKKLLKYENTPSDKREFLSRIKKGEIQFLAISGQHSARAARWVIEWAKKDAKLTDVAEKLRFRKSRILSDRTPTTLLAEHSMRSNAVNETMIFQSCFLDTIVHARRQFVQCGRPRKPKYGDNKSNALDNQDFQDWLKLARITTGKKDLKNVYWLLFSSDSLFELWREVCQLWVDGTLPDAVGETGKVKHPKIISVAMFRCFEGDITTDEITDILEKVASGAALLKKDANNKSSVPSMEELAKDVKIYRKLKILIQEYFHLKDPKTFVSDNNWNSVVSVLPALETDAEMKRCRRAAGEVLLTNLLKRNQARESCPPSLAMRLDDLYCQVLGDGQRSRSQPFLTFLSNNLMKTVEPESLEQASPNCPLAFVDFYRVGQRLWTEAEILVLLEYIVDLPRNSTIVVVFSIYPGELSLNVQNAVKKLGKDRSLGIHSEYGTYHREDQSHPSDVLWEGAIEQVLFVGISRDEDIVWREVFRPTKTWKPRWVLGGQDDDFLVQEIKKLSKGKKRVEEASEDITDLFLSPTEAVMMLDMAPRFDVVGLTGGWVNPRAKPRRMINKIIELFSEAGDTILDFFSGGQVLKCSLSLERESFAYCDSKSERDFVEAYATLLCEMVPIIAAFIESRAGNTAQPNKKTERTVEKSSSSSSSSSSEEDPAEYAVDFNDRLGGGENLDIVDDFENIGNAPQSNGGPNAETIMPDPQANRVEPEIDRQRAQEGVATGVDDMDNMTTGRDDLDPSTLFGRAELDPVTTRIEPEELQGGDNLDHNGAIDNADRVALGGDRLDVAHRSSPELNYEQVSSNRASQTPPRGGMENDSQQCQENANVNEANLGGGSAAASSTGANQAGGSVCSSHTLFSSSDDALIFLPPNATSPIILKRVESKGKTIGSTGWTKLAADCQFYVWNSGPNKGKRVPIDKVPSFLNHEDYRKHQLDPQYKKGEWGLLVPRWSDPYEVEESVSQANVEIQKELGDVVIDEFGHNEMC